MACNLCGSDAIDCLYSLSKDQEIMRCRDCGLQFLHPFPRQDCLSNIYTAEYFKAWGIKEDRKISDGLKKMFYNAIFQEIEKVIPPGSFLDAGCAFGGALAVAKNRGWRASGVEISEEAYVEARQKNPEQIYQGDFCRLDLPQDSFDLVTMLDFLEHVCNPIEAMAKANHALKRKGLIAIVTPDSDSFSARIMQRSWPHIKLEHLYYFCRKALGALLVKGGFRPLLFKNMWKPMNFMYFVSQVKSYGPKYQSGILKLTGKIIPNKIKLLNIYVPQGEIFALAEKA